MPRKQIYALLGISIEDSNQFIVFPHLNMRWITLFYYLADRDNDFYYHDKNHHIIIPKEAKGKYIWKIERELE